MQELVSNLFQPQPEGDTAKVGGAAAADGGEAAGGAADSSVGVSVAPAGSKATCADAAVAAMAAAALSAVTPSVPDALRDRTVEDVWKEIENQKAKEGTRAKVARKASQQPSLTLEEFLNRTGVTLDDVPGGQASGAGASATTFAGSPTGTAATGATAASGSKGGARGGISSTRKKRGKKEVEGDLLGPGPGRGRKVRRHGETRTDGGLPRAGLFLFFAR